MDHVDIKKLRNDFGNNLLGFAVVTMDIDHMDSGQPAVILKGTLVGILKDSVVNQGIVFHIALPGKQARWVDTEEVRELTNAEKSLLGILFD